MKPSHYMPFQFGQKASFSASKRGGHTLAEVMVSVGLLGLMIISLFAGFSSSFDLTRSARENVRATQILEQRMEVLRLIKWDNVAAGFIPTNFTDTYYTPDPSTPGSGGLAYTGTVQITQAPMADATYSNDLRMIQINLNWTSANILHTRQMVSYVSKYGMQNYRY